MIKIDKTVAQNLLDAYKELSQNRDQRYWKDLPRNEVFYFMQLVAETDDLSQANETLLAYLQNPNELAGTVPPNLDQLVKDLDMYLKERNPQQKAVVRNKFLYDERLLRAKQIKLYLEAQQKLKTLPASPPIAAQVAALRESNQKEPLAFKDIVIKEIKEKRPGLSNDEIVNAANVLTKALETTPLVFAAEKAMSNPKSDLLERLVPDLEQPEDQKETRKTIQKVYEAEVIKTKAAKDLLIKNNIFSKEIVEALIPEEIFSTLIFEVTTNPTTTGALPINTVKIIETTNPVSPREITAQSFEGLLAPSATSTSTVNVSTPTAVITSSPIEMAFMPIAVRIAIPRIAKEDPDTATAQTLYYELGLTESNFRTVARGTGLTNVEINKFEEKLAQYEKAHSFMAITLAAQDAGLTPQIERIRRALSANPKERYESVALLVPPVTGFQGFLLRAGNQLAGKQITYWFEGSIRNNLAKIAGGKVADKAKELVAGSVIGKIAGTALTTLTGGLGAIGNWLLSKAMVGFRSNAGKILTGAGAVLGLMVGGPVGALLGAGIGAGIAGIDWKKYIQYALIGIGALFATFLGAIATPLIVAFIGIPILVALILFVINSGAYVIPGANTIQQCGGASTTVDGGKSFSIMPLGDSITAGFKASGSDELLKSYRDSLAKKLTQNKYNFDFVGSQKTDGDTGTDTDHEGYPAKGTDFLLANIDRILAAHKPDVVLIHAGTNRIAPSLGGLTAEENAANVGKIIDKIHQVNPDTKVLLAQIIMFRGFESDVKAYNNALKDLYNKRSDKANILLVNMEGLLGEGDYVDSVLHPNEQGYEKMASAWFSALQTVLSVSNTGQASTCQSTGPGCPAGWPVAPGKGIKEFPIVQGPSGLYSHLSLEAIDIETQGSIGFPVTTTHSGTVEAVYPEENYDAYGKLVVIKGNCNNKDFYSMYAHLSSIEVTQGQPVREGQQIGLSGSSGTDNAHVHYEFRQNFIPLVRNDVDKPPFMGIPYIPKNVPIGCYYPGNLCSVVIP